MAVSARRADKLEALAATLRGRGTQALAVPCDVCDEAALREGARAVVAGLGALDIVLANAGCSVVGRVEELTAADWRRQLDINLVGAALTAKHALPYLRETRGRLALTGSVAGFMSAPGWGAYHASKYALRALGQTLSAELAGSGVTCTTLHPGFVDSEIMKVDNRGVLDPSLPDERPALLRWSAEDAARVMVDAIVRRKRELVFTGHGKVAAWVGMHLPSLMHTVMASGPMVERARSFRKSP